MSKVYLCLSVHLNVNRLRLMALKSVAVLSSGVASEMALFASPRTFGSLKKWTC